MYTFLVQSHSILRYVALVLLLILLINSLIGMINKSENSLQSKRISLYTMLVFHLQLILGIVLYFTSPKVIFDSMTMKNAMLRFFALEHPLLMIIAIVLITIGHIKAKRKSSSKSYKILFIFSLIALIILIAGIPWPFRESLGATWF